MHAIEFSGIELELLKTMLTKEIEETRVEMHHARNMDYRHFLSEREGALKACSRRSAWGGMDESGAGAVAK